MRRALVVWGSLWLSACGSSADGKDAATGGGGQTGDAAAAGSGGTSSAGGGTSNTTGGASTEAGGPADTPEGFCKAWVSEAVRLGAECSGTPPSIWAAILDPTAECRHVADAVSKGRLAFSSRDARSCLDALVTVDCSAAAVAPASSTYSVCLTALAGMVPLGGTCRSFDMLQSLQECAGQAHCVRASSEDCTGTCQAYLGAGDACGSGDTECAEGLSCVNQLCTANAKAGEPCEGPSFPICGGGLFCDGGDSLQAGSCKVRGTSSPCTNSLECASYYYCDATGHCAHQKSAGEACTPGLRECATFDYCNAGRCADGLPGLGEPCGIIAGESVSCGAGYCARAAGASQGTCQPKRQPGDPCTAQYGQCTGDYARCDTSTGHCVSCDGL